MADRVDAILARTGSGEDEDVDKILARKQLDPRGRPYDPRFAPEPEEPGRQFPNNTGSYADIQAQQQADKRNARASAQTGDKVAPYGLSGVVTGQGGEQPNVSRGESFGRGALQGASLGFGDEAAALIDTAASKIPGVRSFADTFQAAGLPPISDSNVTYQQRRDAYREKNEAAATAHPGYYTGGEVAGGLAVSPVLPGGGGGVWGAVKGGAAYGSTIGLGTSNAELSPLVGLGQPGDTQHLAQSIKQAGYDVAKSGIAGAATAGLLSGPTKSLFDNATKNAQGWVVNDIIGDVKGASTPTARKQLADDAVNAARIVRTDKPLDKAIDLARHGNVEEVQAAKNIINDRLHTVGARLQPGWEAIEHAMPEPLTSGRVLDHLDERIAGLERTGHTTDRAEAAALEGIKGRLQTAGDWGAEKTTFDPNTPIGGGDLKGMKAGDAIKMLEKSKASLLTGNAPRATAAAPPAEPAPFLKPTAQTPSEPGYAYHATNEERLHEIANGGLKTHKPGEFTDQDVWPDGSTERRNYFTPKAGSAWSFAPEEGQPVLLRVKQGAHELHQEGTGDLYSRKTVSPDKIEVGLADGKWVPLTKYAKTEPAPTTASKMTPKEAFERGAVTPSYAARTAATHEYVKNYPRNAALPEETGADMPVYQGKPVDLEAFRAHPEWYPGVKWENSQTADLVPAEAPSGAPPAGPANPAWVHHTELPPEEAANRAATHEYARSHIGLRGRTQFAGIRSKAFGPNAKPFQPTSIEPEPPPPAPGPGEEGHGFHVSHPADYLQPIAEVGSDVQEEALERMADAASEEKQTPKVQRAPMGRTAAIDAEIQRIRDAATTKGFDPNHAISPQQLQQLWSDEAGIAYQSQGGINGTATFNRKLDVAGHLRDLRDEVLAEASKNAPDTVASMRADLQRYSALKRIEQVMDMRLNAAKSAGNSGIPDWVRTVGRHISGHGSWASIPPLLATGHWKLASTVAAPLAYAAGKRALDRGAARLVGASGQSALAREIIRLTQQGIPRIAAIQMARSMANGGLLGGIVDQAANSIGGNQDDQ